MKADKKSPLKFKELRHDKIRGAHPSLETDDFAGSWVDQLDEGALQFIAEALTSGKLIAPTPFEELEREHPILWAQAQKAFGSPDAARSWLETRTELFSCQRPLSMAMRTGGEKVVLEILERLAPTKLAEQDTSTKIIRGKTQR